jgi:hypothetical protein
MFPKMFILSLLLLLAAFDGISALPKTVKSGQEAAVEAYNKFVILTNENAKTTEDFLDAQFMTKVADLKNMEQSAIKGLNGKINENQIRAMYRSMGRKPSEADIKKTMNAFKRGK